MKEPDRLMRSLRPAYGLDERCGNSGARRARARPRPELVTRRRLAEAALQRADADAQDPSGSDLVAFGLVEHPLDVLGLQLG